MDQSRDEFTGAKHAVLDKAPRDPTAPLEAAEALEGIRAVMDVMHAPAVDEAAAAAFRLIQAILDRAPGSLPEE
jgi:hypothetical protein